ncbi:MAG: hypothetical protein M3O46_16895, partial [Myxococcota bacterium]|nr:hypothetical protein [Myxococcota bacterium]
NSELGSSKTQNDSAARVSFIESRECLDRGRASPVGVRGSFLAKRATPIRQRGTFLHEAAIPHR